jgi:DNA repair exonuclease SbcCD ATPase subunit
MSVKLSYVKLAGFRSFKDEQVVPFADGATLIRGWRDESEVGSGTGKSSVVMAIAYVLDFSAPPATALKNWYSKKMFVELGLDVNGELVVAYRDQKLRKVKVGDVEYIGPDADAQLNKIVGTERSLAEVLCYRAQKSSGAFLGSTDSARKEFLSKLLQISEIEKGIEKLQNQLTVEKNFLASATLRKQTLASGMMSEEQVRNEHEAASAALIQTEAALGAVRANLQSVDELLKLKTSLKQDYDRCVTAKFKVDSNANENAAARSRILQLQGEIKTLSANRCPTCSQEWNSTAAAIAQKRQEMDNLMARMNSNVQFKTQAQPMLEAMPKIYAEMAEIDQKIGSAKAPLAHAESAHSSAVARKRSAESMMAKIEESKHTISQLDQEIASRESDIKLLEIAAELPGRSGFLSVIFDEVLNEIEARANDMISSVPNVNSFSLKLSSSSTLKNGTTKNSISVKLFKDDFEVDVSVVSGGQRCALDLIVDLAIRETVKARSGCPLSWVCLDEAMDGLDTATKQEMLGMIFRKTSGQVIVIDHETKVQEGFSSVIKINFDGRNSTVVD